MIAISPKPTFVRGPDCLQTRSRNPRSHPPNFALLCDWAIWRAGHVLGRDETPGVVYLRSDPKTLAWFVEDVLAELSSPFALVTASHDQPMPQAWGAQTGFDWEQVLTHPGLVAWFTENRDLEHERIHPLTLGIPRPDLPSWIEGADDQGVWNPETFIAARAWRFETKSPSVFGCWHNRADHGSGTNPPGSAERSACLDHFSDEPFFAWQDPGMSHDRFLREMRNHRFVVCPHGGGLDPSPKAWEALHVGTIPIVKRNSMSDAFNGLPVVIVDDWAEVTVASLGHWHDVHRPGIESPDLDHRLSNEALLDKIKATLREAA